MSDLGPFLRHIASELKRRRVLRVAGAYAAVAFVVAQAADITFPALGLPAWTMTLVIVLLLIGFPFALVFSWIFDVTPEGLRRTEAPAAGEAKLTDASGAPGGGGPGDGARQLFRSRAAGLATAAGVLVLALAAGAFMMHGAGEAAAAEEERELSIAVLPFVNQSADEGNQYFSDGLTEAIQLRLNRLGNLRVTSITSVMTYRGTSKQMREIAAELGVDHVVEGSVRRVGDQVRISARLVEAATDRTLWSDVLDRPFAEVLAVETEIAEQIAAGLRLRLSAAQRSRLALGGTGSAAAYDLYMKARQIMRETVDLDFTSSKATFYAALSLLRQAVDADPGYAEAWAELSWLHSYHPDLPREAREDSARAMAERAIRLAPDLPDGYLAMGVMLRGTGRDAFAEALRQFELALERNPNHVEAILAYANMARADLRLVEQARLVHRAARLEPTNPAPPSELMGILDMLGDWEGVIAWGERTRPLLPPGFDYTFAWHGALATMYHEMGMQALAEQHYARYLELVPDAEAAWSRTMSLHQRFDRPERAVALAERLAQAVERFPHVDGMPPESKWGTWYSIGFALAAAGDTARGHDFLRRAEEANLEHRRRYCPDSGCKTTSLARLNAYRGDVDRALEYLQLSISIGWVDVYPGSRMVQGWFRNISGDPRYQRIMSDFVAGFDRQREELRLEGINRP